MNTSLHFNTFWNTSKYFVPHPHKVEHKNAFCKFFFVKKLLNALCSYEEFHDEKVWRTEYENLSDKDYKFRTFKIQHSGSLFLSKFSCPVLLASIWFELKEKSVDSKNRNLKIVRIFYIRSYRKIYSLHDRQATPFFDSMNM